jgi:hypothetical protein
MAVDDQLHCCHCDTGLSGKRADFVARDYRDMLSHLGMHMEAGHRIPAEAIATPKSQAEGLAPSRAQCSRYFRIQALVRFGIGRQSN